MEVTKWWIYWVVNQHYYFWGTKVQQFLYRLFLKLPDMITIDIVYKFKKKRNGNLKKKQLCCSFDKFINDSDSAVLYIVPESNKSSSKFSEK